MWTLAVVFSLSILRHGFAATEIPCPGSGPDAKFNQADYYWRDYFGVIPKDAVEGGFTETGNKTYVGQMGSYKLVGIFPVYLIPGIKGGWGAIVEKVYEDTYVKILCSPRHKEFEWKSTTADSMHLLTDYHLVIGGAQITTVTYIGRANYIDQVQIGRIHTKNRGDARGLWINNREGKQTNFREFEILVLPRI